MAEHLIDMVQESIRRNWDELALTDFNGDSFQYRDVARKIAKLHIAFEAAGIKPGNRIALCGRNSAQWAVAFLATLTYGAVAVPILHEFKPDNIHHLVTHSDARLLFVNNGIWENLDPDSMPGLEGAVRINDYSLLLSRNKKFTQAREHLNELFGKRYPERFTREDVVYQSRPIDDLALINYTSGSTGFSKGVMLSYRALWSNVQFSIDGLSFLKPGDTMVCMLPLAHMYGLAFELMQSVVKGCHVFFLTRVPSPRILIEAFAKAKPKLIITVPLVIEKIIKTKVFPVIDKPLMKFLLHLPVIDDKLLEKVKTKLTDTFGGQLQEMIIGGAALNKDVETFLRRIKFPYTVGYGMTECAPLISYAPWREQRQGSCGRVVDRMTVKVDSSDSEHVPGEIWVKGDNMMQGYYKNPEATAAVMHDGWMNTGDTGTVDADGYIYLRGRSKNMILGPSGQNIYPEEIEQQLNNMPYVNESLVIDDHGKLVALVYPDFESATKDGMDAQALEKQMDENISQLNKQLEAYSQIKGLKIFHEEFEKTPKRSIKRFLYTSAK